MKVPLSVSYLIDRFLIEVRQDEKHNFNPLHRLYLYNSFTPNVLIADYFSHLQDLEMHKVQRWLAILTAHKVVPIWEEALRNTPYTSFAQNMLTTAEEFLRRKITEREFVRRWSEDYYHQISGVANITSYGVWCAADAAYKAQGGCIFEERPTEYSRFDDMIYENKGDVASAAVKSFSIIEEGKDRIETWDNANFDSNKRLEFWEWWLTEAIPEAWAMVEE